MESLLLVVHYLVSIFLIIVILLQAGKGADMGVTFGGGSQTVFGGRGAATFLSKLTTGVAIVFLFTSISLAGIAKNKSKSTILKTVPQEAPIKSPETQLMPVAPPETAPTK